MLSRVSFPSFWKNHVNHFGTADPLRLCPSLPRQLRYLTEDVKKFLFGINDTIPIKVKITNY